MKNKLYYGDNLEILRNRENFPDKCVDLIYLDPPFNSNRNYNVLFKSESGADSEAQITAFEDTWHWGETAEDTYHDLITDAPEKVSTAIEALLNLIDRNQMMAYLVMMAARLVELHRVLKPAGSLYLHCDPTASHYLKILLDAIFGVENFRNEIVWKRTSAHNDAKRFGKIHDILFYYSRNRKQVYFEPVYVDYSEDYLNEKFKQDENGRWYKLENLTAPYRGGPGGRFMFHEKIPGPTRMWSKSEETMEQLWNEGLIKTGRDGKPRLDGLIEYLDEKEGMPVQDWWDDIPRIANTANERLHYPTQKPLALLERIIRASSNEGEVVLDPFCGCGTAIAAAHKLNRRWIGIDITHLSIALKSTACRIRSSWFPVATTRSSANRPQKTPRGSWRQIQQTKGVSNSNGGPCRCWGRNRSAGKAVRGVAKKARTKALTVSSTSSRKMIRASRRPEKSSFRSNRARSNRATSAI